MCITGVQVPGYLWSTTCLVSVLILGRLIPKHKERPPKLLRPGRYLYYFRCASAQKV